MKQLFLFFNIIYVIIYNSLFKFACADIDQDMVDVCDDSTVPGAEERIIIINYDDWKAATITYDPTNDKIITAITLPSGKEGYQYDSKTVAIDAGYTTEKLVGRNYFKHYVNLVSFRNDPESKRQIDRLSAGVFVAIVENKHKTTLADGDSAFEVYGLKGLEYSEEGTRNLQAENAGGHVINLIGPEMVYESEIPKTIFVTNYSYSKAVVDGLLTPAP